ncbi:MAG TPA: penicillin-binding protein 2 [Clostridiales bacterium]|nr:penicillin-binding protein 2 [Clostridiales bacterium]
MPMKRNIKLLLGVFTIAFFMLAAYLVYIVVFEGDRNYNNVYNRRITTQDKRGEIRSRDGQVLARSVRQGDVWVREYPMANIFSHVVGFVDKDMRASGIELSHTRELEGLNNSIFRKIFHKIFLGEIQGNNLELTLDSRLQKIACDAMPSGVKGAIVLMNPKNGEILAMVSKPDFDPNNMEAVKEQREKGESSVLVNRAVQGKYPPGSTFKIVTSVCALDNIEGMLDRKYNCEGTVSIQGSQLSCSGGTAHGNVDLFGAFGVSCNTTFAKIGSELKRDVMLKTAESFMFNKTFYFRDIITNTTSNFPTGGGDSELAQNAIGQGQVVVTPLHMALIVNSIANDGVMMEPRLVRSIQTYNNMDLKKMSPREVTTVTSPQTAQIIKDMMVEVVNTGTGRVVALDSTQVAAKTGTAEVGGNARPHGWFVAFAPADDPTLSVVVILENVGSGAGNCGPIAKKLLKEAIKFGY